MSITGLRVKPPHSLQLRYHKDTHLYKKNTDNFCIYIHSRCYKSFFLPFNVRPISVTCQFVIRFVLFSYVGFVLSFTCYFFISRTVKQRRLQYDSYIVRMTSRDATLTQRQRILWIFRDVHVMLWVISSLQER